MELNETQIRMLELMDVVDLKKYANTIQKDYYTTRERLFNETRRYFNQNVYSNAVKEDYIIELTETCKRLKALFKKTQELLHDCRDEFLRLELV